MEMHPGTSNTWGLRQEGPEFEISLGYITSYIVHFLPCPPKTSGLSLKVSLPSFRLLCPSLSEQNLKLRLLVTVQHTSVAMVPARSGLPQGSE